MLANKKVWNSEVIQDEQAGDGPLGIGQLRASSVFSILRHAKAVSLCQTQWTGYNQSDDSRFSVGFVSTG